MVLPALGAGGLLHPFRRSVVTKPPPSCDVAVFTGLDVNLEGWRCKPSGTRRGLLVYLHGVADNRASGSAIIERFRQRGFETIAYDSRAHGSSGGQACTYGVLEKQDLRRVIDQVEPGPVVLIGMSLGAAVALQAAADDPRVRIVVAAETFSDLRTVVRQRAPFFVTDGALARVFELAERDGRFDVDDASAVAAAARITQPVLLIHGAADVDTPPEHSRNVFAALRGLRRLMLVPGAAHNGSLRREIWPEIDNWIDAAVPPIG
jgi:pimeloyl-ACP methyl ester carboxylesterase